MAKLGNISESEKLVKQTFGKNEIYLQKFFGETNFLSKNLWSKNSWSKNFGLIFFWLYNPCSKNFQSKKCQVQKMIRVNHGGGVDAPPPSSSNSRVKTFRIIYQLLNMVNPKIKSCLNS